ncbi:glycoside hydrolase family 9 protein [Acetivibrio cellulolyticus]|uniref:glycoside hydrolase family 9 protein n=1 Tax=Acetivibrio cellulolyticus TaxID=35830 RepID=UPI0001E2D42D|nr:glycoside hydrolase family 9 protein [Acetivibrio cellulolyticus]
MKKIRGKVALKKFSRAITVMLVASLMSSLFVSGQKTQAADLPRAGEAYYNYGEAMQKAILFYKANRLGDLPDDYILPYRSDAAMNDGKDVGLDLTGGWADAGDGIKFTHPMSYAAGQLGWAVYEYRDAFKKSGQLDDILDEIKWATDFFIKAHPSPDVLYYMCGYNDSDHSVWVAHEMLDYMTDRKSFVLDSSTPGSDVAGQTAACLAIASLIFEETDPEYAATCLKHAEEIFAFGDKYRGKNPLNVLYPSGGYIDDLAWGATWLYIKTGDSSYLDKAKEILPATKLGGGHTHCWDDVSYGAGIKIAQLTHDDAYEAMVEKNLDFWQPSGGITYTPGGLAWLSPWGSLRYASTAAFLAFVWSDDETVGTPSKKAAYRAFAERQINYALGDNPRGGSYEVGFGENAPVHPHHRTAHGSWTSQLTSPTFHRHILYGALVGGPSSDDSWKDDIKDYTLNEVATDYNAGFVGSLAKMYDMYGGDPLENWPQPEDFRDPQDNITEYFCRGWIIYEGYGNLRLMFQLNNRSSWPPTMKDKLSVRYYMDLSELFEAGKGLDDVQITLEESQGAKLIGLKQYKDNIYYFTVDFSGTQIMPAEWEMCEKDATVSIKYKDSNIGSSKNDWSYQTLSGPPDYDALSFKGLTPYIPVYDNGVLLWGEEPLSGTITPTPSVTPTPTPTNLGITYGDLNEDGKINSIDFALLRCELLGIAHAKINLSAADVNVDGKVNSLDFAVLRKYLLGMVASLP